MQKFTQNIRSALGPIYSESEIRIFGEMILEKLTGLNRTQLLVNKTLQLTENQAKLALLYIQRLGKNEPIQYILGEASFFELTIYVNSSVLIPRPETEELVQWIIEDCSLEEKNNILDVGSGSGCIPISIKKRMPRTSVSGMDISEAALKLARSNAEFNQVDVQFIQDDILNLKNKYEKFDVIVSNPPYIPISEMEAMDKNVTVFEPHIALFVEDDNVLIFYHKIAEFALTHLTLGGKIYFETHKNLAGKVGEMLKRYGFADVRIRKDISGNERMVRAVYLG